MELAGFSGPIVAHIHYLSSGVVLGYTSSSLALSDQSSEVLFPANSYEFQRSAEIATAVLEIEIGGQIVSRMRMPIYFVTTPAGKQLAQQREFAVELMRQRATPTARPSANKAEPGDDGQPRHARGETSACDTRHFCLGGAQ